MTSHALFKDSKDVEKMKLYKLYYPLISRIWNNPNNKNSRYNYYKSQQASIFPKDKISYYQDLFGNNRREEGEFHRNIKLIKPVQSDYISLDDF